MRFAQRGEGGLMHQALLMIRVLHIGKRGGGFEVPELAGPVTQRGGEIQVFRYRAPQNRRTGC